MANALEYMRSKNVFSRDLSIPATAFAKSIELLHKAGLADGTVVAGAQRILDDSYRAEAASSFDGRR
jgi:hypothetical protein